MDAIILTGIVIGGLAIIGALYLKYKEKKEKKEKSQDRPN